MTIPTTLTAAFQASVTTLRTMLRHRAVIQDSLSMLAATMQQRGRLHDLSKYSTAEFQGFVELTAALAEHPPDSPGRAAAFARLMLPDGAFTHHAQVNRHHPEHHQQATDMTFLDIIELVCDWHAAALAYDDGSAASFMTRFPDELKKANFSAGQQWLAWQVAKWLAAHRPGEVQVP